MNLGERLNLGWRRKIPLVLQSEASECGLASLCMVAGHYGRGETLPDLRRRFGSSLKGATLKDLVRVADAMGFVARPLRLELPELAQLRVPCILHWDMNHFVVLVRVDRNTIRIHDPAIGIRDMPIAVAGAHFTGIALELMPSASFQASTPPPRIRPFQLLGHIQGLRHFLGYLLGMAGAIEIFAIIMPFFMGLVVDRALVSADRDLLTTLAFGFGLLMLLRIVVETLRRWMLMGLNASMKVQSRANLLTHLMGLPLGYFESRHLGDIMSRFGSQETILQAVTTDLVEAVVDGLMAVITLVVMLLLSPVLTLLVVGAGAIYALIRWISFMPMRHAASEAIVWGARRDSHILESMRGIRTIKVFNAQEDRRTQWLNLLVETVNAQLGSDKLRLVVATANSLLFGAVTILVVWIGATAVLDGSMSVGLLLAFIAYKDQFLGRLTELIGRVVDLSMLRLHAERLADIALTPPEVTSGSSVARLEPTSVEITVRNLSFRYSEQDPWILRDVSFTIKPEQSVAIVGPSGCGKTTLLKILAGLLQPTEGEVLLNGVPLTRIGLARYRQMIGVVMQDDSLFAGSVAENISFFVDQPSQQLVEDCATLAAVHDDIAAMPMGYGTLIGDMGTVLSGGQKQRILIARALYRLPFLLLFDEATSHLDVERERMVNDALRVSQITRIVIAHRPDTINASDRIIRLDNGHMVEQEAVGFSAARG